MEILFLAAVTLAVLSPLIIVHELGHFLTAKLFRVTIKEFGVGFPPRLFSIWTGSTTVQVNEATSYTPTPGLETVRPGALIKVRAVLQEDGSYLAREIGQSRKRPVESDGEIVLEGKVRAVQGDRLSLAPMLYSVNAVPLGGFVRMAGEEDPSIPGSLASKPVWKRFLVMVAGSGMNILLAFLLFTFVATLPYQTLAGTVVIVEVASGSPAEGAGLRLGDEIAAVDGRPISRTSELGKLVRERLEKVITLTVTRQGTPLSVSLRPRSDPPVNQGPMGVVIGLKDPYAITERLPLWEAPLAGFQQSVLVLALVQQEMGRWVAGQAEPQVSGPIGIAQMTGEVAKFGILPLLQFAGLLSLNLGILNILPIPALDGGRVLFLVLEVLRGGRRISPKKEAMVHLVGFAVLLSLILLVSYFDILRLLSGQPLVPSG
ncbi:MAG: RIP metalloprotease RseP [Chloroflexi bacterium]|nr:RIP metalloprotease RseP [Chloroflexota bacterium]